jgi:hypothetical protein
MAAATAIERELLSGRDYSMAQDSDEALARVALEAAAPILAEAWGVAKRKPGTTRDPRAGITCRRCGAQPGQQCVTSSGTRAPMVHAERRNDARRAEGQTVGLEQEGTYMDRFPPPATRG